MLLRQAENERTAELQRKWVDDVGHALGGAPIGGGLGGPGPVFDASPGARFIESEGYKAARDPTQRPERWSTGLIEVGAPYMQLKGTFGELGSGVVIGGGAFVSVPQVVPGVVDTCFSRSPSRGCCCRARRPAPMCA